MAGFGGEGHLDAAAAEEEADLERAGVLRDGRTDGRQVRSVGEK